MHHISVSVPPYNADLFSLPWIAGVDFSNSEKGEFSHGKFQPLDKGGTLEIEAQTGDIIALVLKEGRFPIKLQPKWYQVGFGGKMLPLRDIREARERFKTQSSLRSGAPKENSPEVPNPLAKFTTKALETELRNRRNERLNRLTLSK